MQVRVCNHSDETARRDAVALNGCLGMEHVVAERTGSAEQTLQRQQVWQMCSGLTQPVLPRCNKTNRSGGSGSSGGGGE